LNDFINFPEFELPIYLEKLSKDSKAIWGKMSAQHMLEHLVWLLKISSNKVQFEIVTPFENIPKLKQLFLLSDLEFRRNFIAPYIGEKLLPLQFNSLEAAKTELQSEIDFFNEYYLNSHDKLCAHPIFGLLTKYEWIRFHSKHFTHHFKQFGLIDHLR